MKKSFFDYRNEGVWQRAHTDKMAGRSGADIVKRLRADTQRLWDLVRYQRAELYAASLITDEEYAELASDHAAVKRLEAYDASVIASAKVRQ